MSSSVGWNGMDEIRVSPWETPQGIGPEIVAPHPRGGIRESFRWAWWSSVHPAACSSTAPTLAGLALPAEVELVDRGELTLEQAPLGHPSGRGGLAQVAYLEAAIDAARAGDIAGLVTAPISKSTARAAHFEWSGHTEFLAARLDASRVAMMFVGPRLKVVLATTHMPLMAVSAALTIDRVAGVTLMGVEALRDDFGIARPRIAVWASIRTPASRASSATRRSGSSPPPSCWPGTGLAYIGRSQRTPCSSRPSAANTTPWSPCTTTRG